MEFSSDGLSVVTIESANVVSSTDVSPTFVVCSSRVDDLSSIVALLGLFRLVTPFDVDDDDDDDGVDSVVWLLRS